MTTKEQQTIDSLYKVVNELRVENNRFREDITNQTQVLSDKIEKKHVPMDLENEIMDVVDKSLTKAMEAALTGYNSPLTKYAHNVVAKYQTEIEAVFNAVVSEGIKTEQFKERVREVLLHKIAKTIISGIDGSVDKTVNLMKQDAIFRSKLTLSVNTIVEEFLNQPK
jgi:hemoglobin-like flavoprotein